MLTARQKRFYTDTCTIYKLTSNIVGVNKQAQDPKYSPIARNVPCHLFNTPEVDLPEMPGRTKQVNIYTLDSFHFAADVDIDDTYVIQLTTVNHPQNGLYWMVEGNSRLLVQSGFRKANLRQAYAKRINPPEVIS